MGFVVLIFLSINMLGTEDKHLDSPFQVNIGVFARK